MNQIVSGFIDVPADPGAMFDKLYEMGVTDGLPVIPPTDEAIFRFIRASGLPGSKEIATIAPTSGSATVEKIAINAIMAGCRAEYMPAMIAAVKALADPAFNCLGAQTTTNPVAPLVVINGPIRLKIDVNCGRGALGPGRRANATIGRALRLMMVNLGGATPGEVDKATLGMPGKYTMCLGENEEESPWPALHTERGFGKEQSTVTVIGVQGNDNIWTPWKKAESILRAWSSCMKSLAANNTIRGSGNPVMLINPGHARLLNDQGFDKRRVQQELWERSKIHESEIPDEEPELKEGNRKMVDGYCMVTEKPEDVLIVVAGGPEAYHNTWCSSFGDYAATSAIEDPEA